MNRTKKKIFSKILYICPNFIHTYNIKLLCGKNLIQGNPTENLNKIILNEEAVKRFGWKDYNDAIGQTIELINFKKKYKIIGIVNNFHFEPLYQKIVPMVMTSGPEMNIISVRISPENAKATIQYIKNIWRKFGNNYPLRYDFLDKRFQTLYENYYKQSTILSTFSSLAIFLVCLGLIGLSSINIDRKTKEIGIRKAHGASVSRIVFLLSKQYLRWILIANIIAWPIAYFIMKKWLTNFAYHINITIWPFLFSGIIVFIIAIFTISFKTIRAAIANPVDALRDE